MSGSPLQLGAGERGIPVVVSSDPDALGGTLAREILDEAERAREEGRNYLLGCPAGRSLRSTYASLADLAAARGADLSHFTVAMMDEYLVPTPDGLRLCPADAHYSCRGYGRREILDRINHGLPRSRRIPRESLWFPEPDDPAAYDERLRSAGGIDLFLVATGASDGHVAFNPIGTPLATRTRVVPISLATRRDNRETFPGFASLDQVPTLGVSVGLGTIAEQSRRVVLVATGAEKRDAVSRLRRYTDFTPEWPASFIFRCRHPRVLVDRSASPLA
jgi:glucosamine-6-phosphate deaminase